MQKDRRFWSKVSERGPYDCWPWLASVDRCGYGKFWDAGSLVPAHRYAYGYKNGEIPDGMLVLHHCDNRRCCNPNHLFIGTLNDNMRDMISKNRGRKGEPGKVSHAKKTRYPISIPL